MELLLVFFFASSSIANIMEGVDLRAIGDQPEYVVNDITGLDINNIFLIIDTLSSEHSDVEFNINCYGITIYKFNNPINENGHRISYVFDKYIHHGGCASNSYIQFLNVSCGEDCSDYNVNIIEAQ